MLDLNINWDLCGKSWFNICNIVCWSGLTRTRGYSRGGKIGRRSTSKLFLRSCYSARKRRRWQSTTILSSLNFPIGTLWLMLRLKSWKRLWNLWDYIVTGLDGCISWGKIFADGVGGSRETRTSWGIPVLSGCTWPTHSNCLSWGIVNRF